MLIPSSLLHSSYCLLQQLNANALNLYGFQSQVLLYKISFFAWFLLHHTVRCLHFLSKNLLLEKPGMKVIRIRIQNFNPKNWSKIDFFLMFQSSIFGQNSRKSIFLLFFRVNQTIISSHFGFKIQIFPKSNFVKTEFLDKNQAFIAACFMYGVSNFSNFSALKAQLK